MGGADGNGIDPRGGAPGEWGPGPRLPLPPIATVRYLGNLVSPLLGGRDTGGRLALVHSVERRGCEPPRHRHRNEDELVFVLGGELTFFLNEAESWVSPGSRLFLPRGGEHGYRVESEQARLLTVLVPAGFEGYYAELDQAGPAADVERLVTVAARYGVEITGPPPGVNRGASEPAVGRP